MVVHEGDRKVSEFKCELLFDEGIDGEVMSSQFIDVVKDIASIADFMEASNGKV